jgi:hypothetical protein
MTYINPRAKPLAHLDRLAAWQKGGMAPPVTLEWDLSNRCSLGCAACHKVPGQESKRPYKPLAGLNDIAPTTVATCAGFLAFIKAFCCASCLENSMR